MLWNCGFQPSGSHCGKQSRCAAAWSCVLTQLQDGPKNHWGWLRSFPVRVKATQSSPLVIWDFNTHQSTEPKIYIQGGSFTTCIHVCLHVSIGTTQNKVFYFFLMLLCNIPCLFGKHTTILLVWVQVGLTSHSTGRGNFRLQRFSNDLPSTSNNFFKRSIKTLNEKDTSWEDIKSLVTLTTPCLSLEFSLLRKALALPGICPFWGPVFDFPLKTVTSWFLCVCLAHGEQGLASQSRAWQAQRQETQKGMSLSDSFSSSSNVYFRFGRKCSASFPFPRLWNLRVVYGLENVSLLHIIFTGSQMERKTLFTKPLTWTEQNS